MAVNQPPLVNGVRHSWVSIKIAFLGRTFTGIMKVDYAETYATEDIGGAGRYPSHRGKGPTKATCSLEIAKFEMDAIIAALPAGTKICDINPFPVVVAYMPEGNDGLITDIIQNCQFVDNKRTAKVGDMGLVVPCDMICSNVDYNV